MSLSIKTTTEIWRVIMKYVAHDDVPKLIRDLDQIQGNISYRDTVATLKTMLREYRKEENK